MSVGAAAVDACKQRLAALPGLKIGLSWQGNSATELQPWLRGRSFALREAAALARLPGIHLLSLQRGEGIEQLAEVEFKAQIAQCINPHDFGPAAVEETAALVMALDLVVTSDTLVAHLAGALGAAVWVVTAFRSGLALAQRTRG